MVNLTNIEHQSVTNNYFSQLKVSGGGHPCEFDEGGPLTQVRLLFKLIFSKQVLLVNSITS